MNNDLHPPSESESQSEDAIAQRAIKQFSDALAPLHLPVFFWVGLPKTNESLHGGSADMDAATRGRLCFQLMEYLKRIPETPEGGIQL